MISVLKNLRKFVQEKQAYSDDWDEGDIRVGAQNAYGEVLDQIDRILKLIEYKSDGRYD